MLTCDFNLCIYQKNGSCTLLVVDINSMGYCDNAIVIDLSEEDLDAYKKSCSKIGYYIKNIFYKKYFNEDVYIF